MTLSQQTLRELLEAIGARTPTPGGGAVAGIAGSLSAALALMACRYSSESLESLAEGSPEGDGVAGRFASSAERFLELAEADQAAFSQLQAAWKLPKDAPGREAELQRCSLAAIEPPLGVIREASSLLALSRRAAPAISRHLKSDLAMAAVMLEAAARASRWNVQVNAGGVGGERGQALLSEADALLRGASADLEEAVALCAS